MSGHSKWSTIKRKKGATDAKRSQVFSKLSKLITVAARAGGDLEMNASLRMIVEKAKQTNMPTDNIERAIKKGTGELEGVKMEEILYEAYGPGGIAMLIECITDNTNRTLSEVKNIISKLGGRFGSEGSVKWMFDRKGYLEIKKSGSDKNKEELELAIIDAGAEDFSEKNEVIEIYTKPEDLYKVKNNLEEQGIKTENAGLDWIPKDEVKIDDEKIISQIEKLFEALDEQDDVNEVYSNLGD